MRELIFHGPGRLGWCDAPDPVLKDAGDALVRPVAVTVCDGDRAILRGDFPAVTPFAFGHEFVADVVELGTSVEGVSAGDRVIVPVQISCGRCSRCRGGLTAHCDGVQRPAAWGLGAFGGDWPGAFADLVRVPFASHMLVKVPDGISPVAAASAGDNIPDAWRTVGPRLSTGPSDVLVVGRGSIGLYAVEIANALGASSVDYIDDDPERLAIAQLLGGRALEPQSDISQRYPIVVDASMSADGLRAALRAVAPGGVCTSVFPNFEISLDMFQLWYRGVSLKTGVANARAHVHEVLRLMQSGRIEPMRIVSEVLPWDEAASALKDPSLKPVFVRDDLSPSPSHDG